MILGFGSNEVEIAHKIMDECIAAVESCPKNPEQAIKSIKKKYDDDEKKYAGMDKQDAPERYTYFWFCYYSPYDQKQIVEFTFHHINRRHALSLDGWGLLATRWVLIIDPQTEGIEKFRQA